MPIAGDWTMPSPTSIRHRFSWLKDFERGMIISADIDGLMSALYMRHIARRLHDQSCDVVGIYELNGSDCAIYAHPGIRFEDCIEAIWVDHDISRPDIRSIGQHLVLPYDERFTEADLPASLTQSCNPNLSLRNDLDKSLVRGICNKYPFATIHWLMWLWEELPPSQRAKQALLSIPDSSARNRFVFPDNAKDWIKRFGERNFPLDLEVLGDEAQAQQLRGSDETLFRETYKFLPGQFGPAQTMPSLDWASNISLINSAADYIADVMGWEAQYPFICPILERIWQGDRRPLRHGDFLNGRGLRNALDHAVIGERVFSYALLRGMLSREEYNVTYF